MSDDDSAIKEFIAGLQAKFGGSCAVIEGGSERRRSKKVQTFQSPPIYRTEKMRYLKQLYKQGGRNAIAGGVMASHINNITDNVLAGTVVIPAVTFIANKATVAATTAETFAEGAVAAAMVGGDIVNLEDALSGGDHKRNVIVDDPVDLSECLECDEVIDMSEVANGDEKTDTMLLMMTMSDNNKNNY